MNNHSPPLLSNHCEPSCTKQNHCRLQPAPRLQTVLGDGSSVTRAKQKQMTEAAKRMAEPGRTSTPIIISSCELCVRYQLRDTSYSWFVNVNVMCLEYFLEFSCLACIFCICYGTGLWVVGICINISIYNIYIYVICVCV